MRTASLALLFTFVLAGCSEAKMIDASTQVTLRVQIDDPALLDSMTSLRVSLLRQDGDDWVATSSAILPTEHTRWPLDIPILPSSPGSIAKAFEVIVEARAGEDRLAQNRVVAGYVRDSVRVLEIWLYQCPGRDRGFSCAEYDCHGTTCEACTLGGSCEAPPSIDPEALPVFRASDAPEVAQPPAWKSDAGDAPDASPDAAQNEPVPNDCGVNNGGCSDDATCTDAPAGPVCSCGTGFVGDGKSCAFDESCSQLDCDPHATCQLTGTDNRECQCQPGYTGNGIECSNEDECAQTPSICGDNGTCVDTDGAYTCTCKTGYEQTGSGCVLIDENDCSPQPCMNGGTCSDLVNDFDCRCPAGFDGERCERNLDDCTASACTNGTCVDGANTYTCSCATGYTATPDRKSCAQIDDCAGSPCGQGGVCVDGTNTYSCMCASGYSGTGTKSCVNIDDCAAGNACMPGGVCIDGVDSYTCQCDDDVITEGVPPNSCRFSIRGDGIFDAQTGLSWSRQVYSIYKTTDTPTEGCQRQGEGRRPPTLAELQPIIAFDLFNVRFHSDSAKRCWATTTVDVCGPGATMMADVHGLRCVR